MVAAPLWFSGVRGARSAMMQFGIEQASVENMLSLNLTIFENDLVSFICCSPNLYIHGKIFC